jgi:repressor LexA
MRALNVYNGCIREAPTEAELRALLVVIELMSDEGESPSVRRVMQRLGYRSPRSAAWLLGHLVEKGWLRRGRGGRLELVREPDPDAARAETVEVPVVGTASCGSPLLAEENIEAYVPVSTRIAPPMHRHFIVRAKGDSMDRRGINDGDYVLVRQQPVAREGDAVVALIDHEVTLKEFHAGRGAVLLKPVSSNPSHRPIVLSADFQIQGVVVASFPDPAQFKDVERKDE